MSTAAAGLLPPDQLDLACPPRAPVNVGPVLVRGASSSTGSDAVHLARGAGDRVVATASPHDHELVRSLGAADVFDHRDRAVVPDLLRSPPGDVLAGTVAIGAGVPVPAISIARRVEGPGRTASAYPTPVTAARRLIVRPLGVHVSAIGGGTPAQNSVGPAISTHFLPAALADARYRPTPPVEVIGDGLAAVPAGLPTTVSTRPVVASHG